MLPLVLRENERILENRERLNTLLVDDQRSPRDNRWLRMRTVDYGVKPDDWTALLDRMDAVPPALGLAQAAIEAGWGGSRPKATHCLVNGPKFRGRASCRNDGPPRRATRCGNLEISARQ